MKDEKKFEFVFPAGKKYRQLVVILGLCLIGIMPVVAQTVKKTDAPPEVVSNTLPTPTPTLKTDETNATPQPLRDDGKIIEASNPLSPTRNAVRDAAASGIEPILIGYNDTIEIQIYNKPQWSGLKRVSPDGTIQMPLIDHNIVAVCKTERELQNELTEVYKKYVRQPYVSVLLRDYSSQPVAVIGKVEKPGSFQLTRRMRLLEVLSLAGGPDKREAGTKIKLARLGSPGVCTASGDNSANDLAGVFVEYNLKNLLEGEEKSNPYVRPGDVISVDKVEKIFVVGNVIKPQPIDLDGQMTVSQAIAAAGGLLPSTKTTAVILYRQESPDSIERKEITIDLESIKKKKSADVALLPNDIIEVPIDGRKEMKRNLFKILTNGIPSIIPAVIYGIPK